MTQAYPKYKDSGIPWIGEIPEGWNCITLKRVFSNRDGGAWGEEAKNNENDRICIRIADFDYPRMTIKHDINYTVRNYAQDVIKKLTLQKNDILVEKSGGGEQTPVGRTIIFNENFEALYANFMDRLRVRRGNVPKFIEYLLVSFYQNGITYQYIKQTTGIQNLDVEELLAKEYAALPSEREQQAIADYLDEKCGAIDKTIETEEKVIEKLKEYKQSIITEAVTKGLDKSVPMKDSGVAWMGKIPQHWKVVNSRRFFRERKERLRRDDKQLTASQKYGIIDQEEFMKLENQKVAVVFKGSEILKHVEPNDFVISMRSFQGGLEHSTVRGCISSAYVMLIPNKAIFSPFYKWVFKSITYIQALQSTSNLVRDGQAMRFNNFVQVPIMILPIKEQQTIAKYLDDKCTKIDKAIADKEQVIEKMAEYKKSLIYECVTGKRMVA